MAGKSNTRKKGRQPAKAPVAPVVEFNPDAKNTLGKSAAFDQAIAASVVLVSHHYHRLLNKYVADGEILAELTVPGADGEEGYKVEPTEQLVQDLQRIQELSLFINNLQRIRTDDAIDVSKNPMT